MIEIGIFILLVLLIISGVWYYHRFKDNELKRKDIEDFFRINIDSIKTANNNFANHLDTKAGYFTNYQLTTWKEKLTYLFNEINGKPFDFLNLLNDEIKAIETFIDYFTNANKLRNDFNKKFVIEELETYQSFFDNIEGRKLDMQQRTALVTDEDNNIVIAGAGSGKTTTIVGKVNYVLDRYKVHPEEILLISFTNKSTSDLANRIHIDGVEAKTFHKFGKDIIRDVEGISPTVFGDNRDDNNNTSQFKELLGGYFNDLLKEKSYLTKVTRYFSDFLKIPVSQFDFETQGEYIQYLKDQNYKSFKQIVPIGLTTLHREIVKSIEECKIANFLLFNSVDYKYEEPYEIDTANFQHGKYKPDFSIYQNGRRIYLEHFGISRNGKVPKWFSKGGSISASEKYRKDMVWKRNTHKINNTTLIESFSYEMSEGILFDNLSKNLIDAKIILKPKSPEEIWDIIKKAAQDEVSNFITFFGTFITLMKSNNYSINDVINRNKQSKDKFIIERNTLFIEIITPIFKRYENYLSERNEIDFSDMINKATKFITSGKYKRKFCYVIIDEFQDISIGRYHLVKALKTNNPSCKLFCVGDDWQSIYRFSGSDIALFKEFEKYFGFTVKSKIETTYRFHNPLITLSSDFIQKNPNQAKKELKGTSNTKITNYKIQYSENDKQDDTFTLQMIFNEIIAIDANIDEKEIIILGRYSFDIDRIKNENSVFRIDKENKTIAYSSNIKGPRIHQITAQFMTVHKAKGLEGDIIIVLNCNSGRYGFPSEMSDDKVLNLLLSEADRFENGEERRLFYVAMTRAKENVFFIADYSHKSKFISELEVESGLSPNKKCPNCKTADIVLKKSGKSQNGNTYKFFGCTNYLYGCDYTTTEWENI